MNGFDSQTFRQPMNMGVLPMPEKPGPAIRATDIEGHQAETEVDHLKEWTLRRTWQGRWYACHPLHGRFYMDPRGSVADQRRAFRAFVRNGGALPAPR